MSDLPKRGYRGVADRQHADTELALKRVRDSMGALAAADIAYTAGDAAQWDATAGPPTTVADALDRIAVAITAAHSAP